MNSRSTKEHQDLKALEEMIEKITVDACGTRGNLRAAP
ncbi:hypothetical protein HNQ81_001825 [Desulfoprunum benzoelyticum]|uniref:Uncharacterized protein n=1 Tax=Desulfoprunum benzoelyticum TaxID=1506996 RepID=A0A840UXC1_9BACT|nr:hypothetical protein [Desulfoprunum benzoelyticum]